MSCIQKLAPHTARLLHSTQSIDSVHSVVKELVENSLDAGATVIYVKLEDFGYDKIEVRDNGHGIGESDLPHVVLPHYTSKISTFEDIQALETYGFRGQGLAAIAAVSRVTITSSLRNKIGHSFTFDQQGKVVAQKQLPWEGTSVTIDRLFKNIPVRRKCLCTSKNKSLDLKKVERLLSALGIAWPGVRLFLFHNKSLLWSRYPCQSFREAVGQVFGMSMLGNMEYVDENDSKNEITIKAFLPKPEDRVRELSSCDMDRMFLLVNRRHVLSKDLCEIIQKKYAEAVTVQTKRYPACAVTISVPPQDVDVNFEPSKTNVAFSKQEAVHNLLETVLGKVYGHSTTSSETNKENRTTVISHTESSSTSTGKKQDGKRTDANNQAASITPETCVQPPNDRFTSSSTRFEVNAADQPRTNGAIPTLPSEPATLQPAQNKSTPRSLSSCTQSGFFGWIGGPAAEEGNGAERREGVPQRSRTSSLSDRISPRKQLQLGTGERGASWSLGLVENSQGRIVEPTVKIVNRSKRTSSSPAEKATPKKLRMPDLSQRRLLDLIPKEKSPMEVFCSRRKDEVLTQNPGMSFKDLTALLEDEWDGLTPAERQQYKDSTRPRNAEMSSVTNSSASKAHTKSAQKSSTLRKTVCTIFSLSNVVEHYRNYLALSQKQDFDDKISIIGFSREADGWLVRSGASIYGLNGFRLKEATLFKTLRVSYSLPMELVYPPIKLDRDSIGANLWSTLVSLQQTTKDFTGASYITDSLLVSNGFEIKLPSGPNGDVAEIFQKARNTGISELREILTKISSPHSGCSLWESRPAKICFYLQGEAARMVQSGPKLNRTDLWELIKQCEDCINEKCIHSKPVCVKLFDMNSLL